MSLGEVLVDLTTGQNVNRTIAVVTAHTHSKSIPKTFWGFTGKVELVQNGSYYIHLVKGHHYELQSFVLLRVSVSTTSAAPSWEVGSASIFLSSGSQLNYFRVR
jgi:ribosomal protein L21E